jgi:hypothetical protein
MAAAFGLGDGGFGAALRDEWPFANCGLEASRSGSNVSTAFRTLGLTRPEDMCAALSVGGWSVLLTTQRRGSLCRAVCRSVTPTLQVDGS